MNTREDMQRPEPDFRVILSLLEVLRPGMSGWDAAVCASQCDKLRAWIAEGQPMEAQPLAPAAGGGLEFAPQDWPEDFSAENGRYECKCVTCGIRFQGHKRRVICKLCSTAPAPPTAAREASESVTLDEWRAGSAVNTVRLTLGRDPPPWRTDRDALLALVTAFDHKTHSQVKDYLALYAAPTAVREAVAWQYRVRFGGKSSPWEPWRDINEITWLSGSQTPHDNIQYRRLFDEAPAVGAVSEAMVDAAHKAYCDHAWGMPDACGAMRAALQAALGGGE